MNRITSIIFLILWGLSTLDAGSFRNTGSAGANFLQIPVEARGAALGNSYVAMARGVEGLYWNQAALSLIENTELIFSHANWLADTRLLYFGVAHPVSKIGAFGLAVTSFQMDKMDITTEYQPTGTGEQFGAGDLAINLSYSRALTDRFSFGITAKYVYEYIWELNTSSMAFDFASLYRTDFHNLRIGMIIANFGGNLKMGGDEIDEKLATELADTSQANNPRKERLSEEYSLPQIFRVGIAFDPWRDETHRFTTSISADDPNDNRSRIGLGAEYAFMESYMLRGGYKINYDEDSFTLGAGAILKVMSTTSRLDYAFSQFGDLGSAHTLSFTFIF